MQIDRQELSAHYASLSDEELLELDRAELTEVAQRFYDSELAKRHMTPEDTETPVEPHGRAAPVDAAEGADEDEDGAAVINFDAGTEPDWLEDATCADALATCPAPSVNSFTVWRNTRLRLRTTRNRTPLPTLTESRRISQVSHFTRTPVAAASEVYLAPFLRLYSVSAPMASLTAVKLFAACTNSLYASSLLPALLSVETPSQDR